MLGKGEGGERREGGKGGRERRGREEQISLYTYGRHGGREGRAVRTSEYT